MADVGKTIGGVILTGAGLALTIATAGAASYAGLVLMGAGMNLLSVGIFGLPELQTGTTVRARSTQANMPVVYGEQKLSHAEAVVHTYTGTNDNDNMVIVGGICLAGDGGKGIHDITEIYLYPDELSVSGGSVVFDTNSGGLNNAGVASKYKSKSTNWYMYELFSGKNAQTVSTWLNNLISLGWPSDSIGKGIAYAVHWFLWDNDEEDPIWAKGSPVNISYKVQGNLLYDPRYPTQGPDSDGWIWSRDDNPAFDQYDNNPGQNPALQLLDYLASERYGLAIPYGPINGASFDEINEQSFEDLADHCDENVTTQGLTPNVTHPRYTSNVILRTGDSHKTNIEKLLGACNAMLVYEGGQFKVIPRKVTTAVAYEITEEKMVGGLTLIREGTTVPNTIKARFVDEDEDYQVMEVVWPEPGTNDFLIADNNFSVERVIDLPCTTKWYQAQQLAMITLREMREDVTVEVTVQEDALQLSVGDVVKFTYDSAGWTQKEFWVVGMSIQSDDLVKLQLNEYDSGVYSVDPQDDRPTTPGTDLPNPFTVIAPTAVAANCAAGYYLNDGVFKPRVDVTWTHTTDAFAIKEELVYKKNTDTEWIFTGITIPTTATTAAASYETDLEIDVDYDFGVVAWNHLEIRSAVAEASGNPCTITGPGDTPGDVTITDSNFTCLEGITIKWDNPAPYTDANNIGVREVQFYFTEIREQGAGATEIDRWNNGTFIDNVLGTEWNLPYDRVTKGTYDLTLRRHDRFGNPQTTPTEIQIVNDDYPCTGFGDNDPSEYGKLIHNGDFEAGGRWWYGPTGAAISAVSPIAGSNSLTITAGGAERWVRQVTDLQDDITLGVDEEDYIAVEEGDYMFLAAYGATTGATATVRAKTYDKNGAFQANIDFFTFTSGTAERKKNFIYIPAGIEFVVVEFAVAAGSGVAKFDNVAGYLFPPRLPTIKELITYPTAASGKLEIQINAAQAVIVSVEMKKYENQVWDAGWTDVTPSPYDMTVTLSEKHPSAITYRVGYDLTGTGEGTTEYLENSVSFDLDTLPELSVPSYDIDPDTGNVILHWAGDDDVASIKYETAATDWASDAAARTAAQGGTAVNNRSGSVALSGAGLPVPESDSVFVAVLAYTAAGGTGTESTEVYRAEVTRGAANAVIVPTIQSQMDYDGSGNGTITLVINDPQTRVTLVEYDSKSGDAAWAGWTTDPSAPWGPWSVALAEAHDSHIRWRVTYTDPIAGSVLIEGNATFDVDVIPEVNSFGLNITAAGVGLLNYHGDDDVGSIKWSWSTSSQPTGATVDAETCPGRCNDGRSEGALNVGAGTVAEGDTLYVSFYAYTGVQAGGTKSNILYECQFTRPVDTVYDTVPADVTGFSNLKFIKGTAARVRLYWTKVTTPGVTHYEIRHGGTGWADATFQGDSPLDGYNLFFGEIPSSNRTYRIKAMNEAESLESANAASTTVSFSSGRPTGTAASLVSSYWRGVGGITRWNLATTNGTIFRFHWGTTVGFTPSDSNALAVVIEDNPTADYAVGLSLAETGWTTDAGRNLYLKVGVKDGLSDELGEGWSYSNGQAITLNPFETTWLKEDTTREFINGSYTDSSRRPILLRKTGGDLSVDDVFDKVNDTPLDIGAQPSITYSNTAPPSPVTGDMWVDLDGVPVSIYRRTSGGAWAKVGNLTEGDLALLDSVDTPQIAAGAITETKIEDNAVTTGKINTNAVTANEINANTITGNEISGTELAAIFAKLGVVTAGLIQDGTNARAILFGTGYSLPGSATHFLDLTASSGADKFLKSGTDMWIEADGDCYFKGSYHATVYVGRSGLGGSGYLQCADEGNKANGFVSLFPGTGATEQSVIFGFQSSTDRYECVVRRNSSDDLDIHTQGQGVEALPGLTASFTDAGDVEFTGRVALDDGTNYLNLEASGDVVAQLFTAGNPPTGGTSRGFVKWHQATPYEIELKNPIMVSAGVSATTTVKSVYSSTSFLFLQSETGVLVDIDSDNNSSSEIFRVRCNKATTLLEILENGTFYIGDGTTTASRTDNMLWIPTTLGAPTGSITAPSNGRVPIVYDSNNNRLYIRDSGAWRWITTTTV